MRSNTDNINNLHELVSGTQGRVGSNLHPGMVDCVLSRFTYGMTEFSQHTYSSDQNCAVILLEPVRNLKWKPGCGEERVSSFTAGTAFVIPANQTLEIWWTEAAEYLQLTIPIAGNLVEIDKESGTDAVSTVAEIVNFSSKQCLQVCQLVIEQLIEPAGGEQNYLASLYSVLVHLLQRNAMIVQSSMVTPAGLSSYAARQIEAYLNDKFREPVSVPDMASALGISAGHFATRFRESFGQTPHQYLMSLRLDEAERWLRETDMPISTIAARLSFSSQSHLTTALRKYRRLTPGEIRRRSSHLRYRTP